MFSQRMDLAEYLQNLNLFVNMFFREVIYDVGDERTKCEFQNKN